MLPTFRTGLEHALEHQAQTKHSADDHVEEEAERARERLQKDFDLANAANLDVEKEQMAQKQLIPGSSEDIAAVAVFTEWKTNGKNEAEVTTIIVETTAVPESLA